MSKHCTLVPTRATTQIDTDDDDIQSLLETMNMTTQLSQSFDSATSPAKAASGVVRYALDSAHTHVGFSVRHLMISNVRGEFLAVNAEASFQPEQPETATLSATIDVASIHTREEKRDAHLRSADFFDAEKYPTITFVSKRVSKTDDGIEVVGDLTIHGITQPVTLAVEDITPERTDPWGNKRIGATARAKIRRSDFGMTWNAAIEAGGFVVGDDIKIEIEAELVRQV
jgi:polyisoprenoid-binding protein YceI